MHHSIVEWYYVALHLRNFNSCWQTFIYGNNYFDFLFLHKCIHVIVRIIFIILDILMKSAESRILIA